MDAKVIDLSFNGNKVEVKAEAGKLVLVDSWNNYRLASLEASDLPELFPFRLPSLNYTDVAYACRIEITGRKSQRRPHQGSLEFVRVNVVFIHDDEPETVQKGWMAV